MMIEKMCRYCGKDFQIDKSLKMHLYCSDECRKNGHESKIRISKKAPRDEWSYYYVEDGRLRLSFKEIKGAKKWIRGDKLPEIVECNLGYQ